jgi:UTP--glucose-1-phosphate uridylyltransferase
VAITDAVVPVAGLGTRLYPATRALPKALLPVGGKPAVQHVVEELQADGIERVVFVIGAGGELIEAHFAEDPAFADIRLVFTHQPRPRGVGDALLCAEGLMPPAPFAMALGDALVPPRGDGAGIAARLGAALEDRGAACALAVEEVPPEQVSRYGIVAPAGDGDVFDISGVVEKPAVADAPSHLAVAARYVFSPEIFGALRRAPLDARGELGTAEAMRGLLAHGHRVVAVRLGDDEPRFDVGSPEGYAEAFVALALADARLGPRLRERLEAVLDDDR